MSERLDIVEVLRRPLVTISQSFHMRYVTSEVAEIAANEIARLRASLAILVHAHSTGHSVPPHIEA